MFLYNFFNAFHTYYLWKCNITQIEICAQIGENDMKKSMFEVGRSSVKLPMPAYVSGSGCIAGSKES